MSRFDNVTVKIKQGSPIKKEVKNSHDQIFSKNQLRRIQQVGRKEIEQQHVHDYKCSSQSSRLSERKSLMRKVKQWNPSSPLGHMVLQGKYKSIKEIRKENLLICDDSVVHFLLGPSMNSDLLGIKPNFDCFGVTRGYTSFACAGDRNGHFGYSVKYNSCRNISVSGAVERATLSINPIKRFSYNIGLKTMHTIAYKVSGTYEDVTVHLLPSFGAAGNKFTNKYIRRMLTLAGIDNCVVEVVGYNYFIGNLILATYKAIEKLEDLD